MASEETLRKEAAALHAQGVKIAEIARRLGRSRQWVYKWIGRKQKGADGWAKSLSNAPRSRASKTCPEVEEMVISSRLKLESSPHMESGAYAIWHDLRSSGVKPPSVATINRILSRRGFSKKKIPYQKSDIDYPQAPINMQIMDLIGPRYLRGGRRYYLLTIISNDTRHAGVYPISGKDAASITNAVVSFWKGYTKPDFLQIDNELSFKGSNRHPRGLGLLLRMALSQNVTPVFIPVGEPWRNGVIERFNQKVERTLLMQKHGSFDALSQHAAEFAEVHNRCHHYSTMGHKTPLQLDEELGEPSAPLDADYMVTTRPELDSFNLNEIRFIRLVRSDLLINVLNTDIKVLPRLAHSYVEAILLINDHRLLINQDGTTQQSIEFTMPLI